MKLKEGVIYGPIESRRLNQSLGINLMPENRKICTFNCVYCYCGPTNSKILSIDELLKVVPSLDQIKKGLKEGFEHHFFHKTHIDYITFAGHGEPTLHPFFPEIVDFVLELRDHYFANKPTAIFTNSTTLESPEKIQAINKLDRKIFKLDASDQMTLNRINRPIIDALLKRIIENLSQLKDIEISTAVFDSKFSNLDSLKNGNYIDAIRKIKPLEVHLYSIDRPSACRGVTRIEKGRMTELASYISDRLNIKVRILQSKKLSPHTYVRAKHSIEAVGT